MSDIEISIDMPKLKVISAKFFFKDEKTGREKTRKVQIPVKTDLHELKLLLSQSYLKTFHSDIKPRKGVETYYKDEDDEWIFFDSTEEWEFCKSQCVKQKRNVKLKLDFSKGKNKEPFVVEKNKKEEVLQPKKVPKPNPGQYPQQMPGQYPMPGYPQQMSGFRQQYPQPGFRPQYAQPGFGPFNPMGMGQQMYPPTGGVQSQQGGVQGQPPMNPQSQNYEKQLKALAEMGFNDVESNVKLLKQFNGDINEVFKSGKLKA